jgi:hypothetical protein
VPAHRTLSELINAPRNETPVAVISALYARGACSTAEFASSCALRPRRRPVLKRSPRKVHLLVGLDDEPMRGLRGQRTAGHATCPRSNFVCMCCRLSIRATSDACMTQQEASPGHISGLNGNISGRRAGSSTCSGEDIQARPQTSQLVSIT